MHHRIPYSLNPSPPLTRCATGLACTGCACGRAGSGRLAGFVTRSLCHMQQHPSPPLAATISKGRKTHHDQRISVAVGPHAHVSRIGPGHVHAHVSRVGPGHATCRVPLQPTADNLRVYKE